MAETEALMDDGNAALAVGDLEAAAACYRRAVEAEPELVDGWHALGMALMKLGRYPEAIAAGLRAVELRPDDQVLWTSLSLAYVRNGQIPEAEAAGAKAKIISWGGKVLPPSKETPG